MLGVPYRCFDDRVREMRQIDWRLLFFGFAACYAIPWLLFGMLVSAAVPVGVALSGWQQLLLSSYLVVYFLAMPLAAGYFTAKFAKNRPQLHVLLLVLLGSVAVMLVSSNSLAVQLGMSVLSLAMASLGAFVVLRGGKRVA